MGGVPGCLSLTSPPECDRRCRAKEGDMKAMTLLAGALALASTAAKADNARLHTFHCLQACPVGAPENADIVVREIYTLAADPLTKVAVWVAYRVTKDTIGPS
jgi:endonuclease G